MGMPRLQDEVAPMTDEKRAFIHRLLALGVPEATIERCAECTSDEVNRVVEDKAFPVRLNNGVLVY